MEEFNGYALGCLVPDSFPTAFTSAADAVTMFTRDQIRAELTKRGGTAFDRRKVFGDDWIKDQSRYGSCNGWSTATAMEKLHYMRTGHWVPLSGADAYSQMNDGEDNGSTLARGMGVVTKGIAPAALVRVDQIFDWQITPAAKEARARFRGLEPYAVDTEEELASGILAGFMGIIAVHVTSGYETLDSEGCPRSGNGVGNHSVHVDDLRLSADGTILFDSPGNWTVNMGDRGRWCYRWDRHLKTTATKHRFWLLRSTMDDPQGENPPAAK